MKTGVSRYCICGDAMKGSVGGSSNKTLQSIARLIVIWDKVHAGPGHADTDMATAAKVRHARTRKEDRRNP